ncbi:unnamed protein product, partial [Nesidiocoris tenuis]
VATRSSHGLEADVWSLGCMLYSLLVGRPPFDTDAVKSTLTKVVMADYQIPPGVSTEAKDLIDRLLKKNPTQRIRLREMLDHPFMTRGLPKIAKVPYNKQQSVDSGMGTISTTHTRSTMSSGHHSRSEERKLFRNKFQPPLLATVQDDEDYASMISGRSNHKSLTANGTGSVFGRTDHDRLAESIDSSQKLDFFGRPIREVRQLPFSNPSQSKHSSHHSTKAPTGPGVPPLNAERLQPTRHLTKNAILSIVDNGEVVVELTRKKAATSDERVVDVCRISSDGLRGYEHCRAIESALEMAANCSSGPVFPVIVGRRPIPLGGILDNTVQTKENASPTQKPVVLANGELTVQYDDGSQIWVNCDSSGRVRYRAPGCDDVVQYGRHSCIPRIVEEKLAQALNLAKQPPPHHQHYRQFAIFTDHRPLLFAFKQKNEKASPVQLRRLQYISEFSTDIRHISGKSNVVADTLSRIESVSIIDMEKVAEAQVSDPELPQLRNSQSSLQFKSFKLPNGSELWCDISTNTIRPFIPKSFRRIFFDQIHNLHHPGIKSSVKQMASRFIWPEIKKDVGEWAKTCLPCQKSKIGRHTSSPVMQFPQPDERFSVVHIDLVGPLPPSDGYLYFLSMIDRYTNWMEAIPLTNITAETVAQAVYENWIVRFGIPSSIISDQGRQFEATLFKNLSSLCGIQLRRTTAYHPQCNGKAERLHRTLKTAIRANGSLKWSRTLPTVLLGLRAAFNPDSGVSIAEMVYGTTIKLPGEFLGQPAPISRDIEPFVTNLQETMRKLKPVPVDHKSHQSVFVHKDLSTSTHAFVRIDRVKKPLEPAYDGPFKILARQEKFFTLLIKQKEVNISLDRLKPAFLLTLPEDPEVRAPATPDSADRVISQKASNQPTQRQTRSGRVVKINSILQNLWTLLPKKPKKFFKIGPEKGVMHLATAAVINALWDLWGRLEDKPVWKLLSDMTPEQLVSTIDFRYIQGLPACRWGRPLRNGPTSPILGLRVSQW